MSALATPLRATAWPTPQLPRIGFELLDIGAAQHLSRVEGWALAFATTGIAIAQGLVAEKNVTKRHVIL